MLTRPTTRRTFLTALAAGLTASLLAPGDAARAQIIPNPPFGPPLLRVEFYWSAIILPRPTPFQQGHANALGLTTGSMVAGAAWDRASPDLKRAARFQTPLSLHPNPLVSTEAFATTTINGQTKQAGVAFLTNRMPDNARAFLWNDSSASFVNMNPVNATASTVYGMAGGSAGLRQVGAATFGTNYVASQWAGTSASFVNLHPAGFRFSEARGTTGDSHVGIGWLSGAGLSPFTGKPVGTQHALLWANGVASDLHPQAPVPGLNGSRTFTHSAALAIFGGQQVGYGMDSTTTHALVWDGAAATARDLHPADSGFTDSAALGLANGFAAGWGYYYGRFHALAWRNADARNMTDLHTVLPAGYEESMAHGVGVYGDIVGWASPTTTVNFGDRDRVPVRWVFRLRVRNIFQLLPREERFFAGNRSGEGLLLMEKAVPKGGATVTLTSLAPDIVRVPDAVTVGSEEDMAIIPLIFSPDTYPRGTTKTVIVRATYAGTTREMPVTVTY